MGINQAILQPASIVDSRFKTDINLVGAHSEINNNAMMFRSKYIMDPFSIVTNEDWWHDFTYINDPDNKQKDIFMSQSVMGPSFLISIGTKHAVGFTYRLRSVTNADGISEPLFRSIYSGFTETEYWNKWFLDKDFRAVQHAFVDYGLSYGAELMNNGAHYLKAGVTVKLLQGISAAYLQSDSLFYYFDATDGNAAYNSSWNSPIVYAGISDNWGTIDDSGYDFSVNYQFTSKPSAGFDFGIVYEFRPKYKDYLYDMDGKKDLERVDQNKYLLKIGASILDVGRLKYEKDYNSFDFVCEFTPDYLERYVSGDNSVPPETEWMNVENSNWSFEDYVTFADSIYQRSETDKGVERSGGDAGKFVLRLPTALSLQVDVNIVKGFYVNLLTYTGLNQGFEKVPNSHYISNYSITPRYEHRWFTVAVPVQINQYQQLNIGLGLRAAFVYFGVNNLFSGLISDPYGLNAYIGVKLPIFKEKPPTDFDSDKVSDDNDLCPAAPGPWELKGCPDRDGDGVTDMEDACPDIAGLVIYKGCPDRDGDGVIDNEDLCPDEPGTKLTNGCPDKDNDGVIDGRDECPDIPGPAALNGCPDRDGDGVADPKDLCPDEPGPADQGGCPFRDTDKDGIKDSEDRCPEVAGPPENFGCPYSDTDGDGILDKDDRCPLTPGDPTNNGCPVIKTEEAAVLKTAFENLEFETGKAVIRSSSFASLDELAELLVSKPTWKLLIAGHTDNVGSEESNLNLSKNRTQAVGKYLQGKGVPANQVKMEWYGESRPVADNSTPDGRQKNRRVEMQVEFE